MADEKQGKPETQPAKIQDAPNKASNSHDADDPAGPPTALGTGNPNIEFLVDYGVNPPLGKIRVETQIEFSDPAINSDFAKLRTFFEDGMVGSRQDVIDILKKAIDKNMHAKNPRGAKAMVEAAFKY